MQKTQIHFWFTGTMCTQHSTKTDLFKNNEFWYKIGNSYKQQHA